MRCSSRGPLLSSQLPLREQALSRPLVRGEVSGAFVVFLGFFLSFRCLSQEVL
jgi:hypothetical protein